MKRLLLTGAGFTKNWGGYLATEVWERLLGHQTVRSSTDMRRILLRHPVNFEAALVDIRALGERERREIDDALVDVFRQQDDLYKSSADEHRTRFHQDTFTTFLDTFRDEDGTAQIFSVNQDLFIERKYRGGPLMAPGIGDIHHDTDSQPWAPRKIDLHATFRIVPSAINYLKMHGSADWRSRDGHVVVAGGDKVGQIGQRFPLLRGYLDYFESICSSGDAWLVTAGYGFRDQHINAAIARGAASGLKLLIANTTDPKVLFGPPDNFPDGLRLNEIWNAVVGYWTAPFSRTFDNRPLPSSFVNYFFGT